MNKYERALKDIIVVLETNNDKKWVMGQLQNLQELVDKETPLKPNGYDCPICEKIFNYAERTEEVNYCSNCSTKIDWSNYNE